VRVDRYGYRSRDTKDQFAISGRRASAPVSSCSRSSTECATSPRPPTWREQSGRVGSGVPKFDDLSSDRLRIDLSGGYEHRQSRWKDSPDRRLEEWLPQVLQEIELRASGGRGRPGWRP
jgi:hypothetical protein